MGLRPIFWVGLGFAAVGLVVVISREANRPRSGDFYIRRDPYSPRQAPPRIEISEGPPMTIDAHELAIAGRERNDNVVKMVFCWCPPGRFSMGGGPKSTKLKNYYLNGPPGLVTLSRGFWMGKYEVTQAQWQTIMGRSLVQQRALDPTQPRSLGDGSKRSDAGVGPDFPVYYTSFQDAEEFCHRLTKAEREAGRLDALSIYRVPTAAEWEFACRAGTTTATAYGNRLSSDQANFDGRAPFNGGAMGAYMRMVQRVGRYPPNAWGLHDMHGNLWEWCRDDPRAPTHLAPPPVRRKHPGPEKPIRGGSWYDPGQYCLSTSWFRIRITGRGSGLGFRVVLVSTEAWREAGQGARGSAR